MSYVRLKHPHRCPFPYIREHGDIWECDECGRQWRSVKPGNPRYNAWRKVWWRRKPAASGPAD